MQIWVRNVLKALAIYTLIEFYINLCIYLNGLLS